MKRLAVLIVLLVGMTAAMPPAASAKVTLASLAKSVKALQTKVNAQAVTIRKQAATISTLQGTVTSHGTGITNIWSILGSDPTSGLQKTVADQGSAISTVQSQIAAMPQMLSGQVSVAAGTTGTILTIPGYGDVTGWQDTTPGNWRVYVTFKNTLSGQKLSAWGFENESTAVYEAQFVHCYQGSVDPGSTFDVGSDISATGALSYHIVVVKPDGHSATIDVAATASIGGPAVFFATVLTD